MRREELEKVRQWADDKIAAGQEPPWAWYQYMKLRETLDAILSGMAATTAAARDGRLTVIADNTKPLPIQLPT